MTSYKKTGANSVLRLSHSVTAGDTDNFHDIEDGGRICLRNVSFVTHNHVTPFGTLTIWKNMMLLFLRFAENSPEKFVASDKRSYFTSYKTITLTAEINPTVLTGKLFRMLKI
jgi:hypothetical protein